MPLRHREISSWLAERGYATGEIEKILGQLDQYDEHANRESLFEDLASGAFTWRRSSKKRWAKRTRKQPRLHEPRQHFGRRGAVGGRLHRAVARPWLKPRMALE